MSFQRNQLPFLHVGVLSEKTKNVEYPIRGKLHYRSKELKIELQEGVKKNFDCVTNLNIGDVHAFGQKPLTFIRQVFNIFIFI